MCSLVIWRGEAEWKKADLTGGPDLGIQTSICGDYERLRQTCPVYNVSNPSLVPDLLLLAIRSVEGMS